MSGRQPNIRPMFGENPVGWWADRKSGRRAFLSCVKHSLVFKAREHGPALVFFQLPCLFCIILYVSPCVSARKILPLFDPAQDNPMARPLYG